VAVTKKSAVAMKLVAVCLLCLTVVAGLTLIVRHFVQS